MDLGGHGSAGNTSTFEAIGEHVLVDAGSGVPPAEAEIVANNWHRPHLVQVAFLRSQTAEWIFRSRISGPASGASQLIAQG